MGGIGMMLSPSAMLLADLAEHGIEVQAHGDVIRFRPRVAMTPELLERLQAHKAELFRFLNTDVVVAELRETVKCLWQDPVWWSAWERRFQAGQFADFASLRRVLEMVIGQAAEHHRRHDWPSFLSTCRFLHRLASGEFWDKAARLDAGVYVET
jgi:hypothetical protein